MPPLTSEEAVGSFGADPSEAEVTEPLHSEFKTLTMLLTLVTALNNSGHPTLLARKRDGNYRGPLEVPQSNRGITLNAITSILVRDTEVVAAIAHDPNPPSEPYPSSSEDAKPEERMTYQVFAMQVDPEWDQLASEALRKPVPSVVTLANHDRRDQYMKQSDPTRFVVQAPRGESHWPLISKESWSGLNIP